MRLSMRHFPNHFTNKAAHRRSVLSALIVCWGLGGALGGALGGRFGLGKKKNADEAKQEETKNGPAAAGNSTSLLDMTTEFTNFAQTADPSLLEVPAGFKKVEPDLKHK